MLAMLQVSLKILNLSGYILLLKITDNIDIPTLKTETKPCSFDIDEVESLNTHFTMSLTNLVKKIDLIYSNVSSFSLISSL